MRATRSGGPGGQHVNTSSSRVEIQWSPSESSALTPDEKERVAQRLTSRIDSNGLIRVAASDTRSQRQNRLLAEQRLASLIARALQVRKKRVKTAPTKSSREERLRVKKLRGRRKRDRGSGELESGRVWGLGFRGDFSAGRLTTHRELSALLLPHACLGIG